jgi:tetratricopeptide (TPR) repeat protein
MSQSETTTPIEAILGRAERADDSATQADLLLEAASLYEATSEYDRAFLVRATAYRLRPSAHERAALDRLVSFSGRLGELDALYAETTPSLPPEERAEALCDLGRLRLRRLHSPELALGALDVALALAPGGEAALLRADALAELGRWREVDAALAAIFDHAASDEERYHALLRMVDVREQHLGELLAAEDACRRALAIDPTRTAARLRLEKLVRARGDLKTLLALLDDRAALAPDDLSAAREAAELTEAVDGIAAAAQRWVALRERLPGDPAPLRALDGIYARLGRVRDRTEVLEALIGQTDSVRERATLQRVLAAAWTELGERGRAIESLEWILEYEPDEATWRALADLYRAEGRFAALADECTRHLATVESSQRPALWRELAGLYERDLGDPGQAIKCWKAVLELETDAVDALQALVPLYEAIDACDRAVDCLERWAALAGDGRTRAHRLLRAAELCASRGDLSDRTSELLERALDADGTSVPIRVALVAHLRQKGEMQRAARLLEAAVAMPGAHVALVAQAAALCESQGDLEGAFTQLRTLVERIPGHIDARWRACLIGQTLGHHADVLELAAALPLARAETAIERCMLIARSARATGDRTLAAEALDRAARLAPERADVQRMQAERLLADGDLDGAERYVETLAASATATASAGDRAAIAFLAGQCAHERHQSAAALACYRKAVALDPSHRAAQRALLDDAVELKRWNEALAALEALVGLERDPSLRARYRHLAGHVCEEELGRPQDALAHYQAALVDDPDHPRASERIAALLRTHGDFSALATHCARVLERMGNSGDVARRTLLWNELAAAAEGLGDRDGTTAALEVVVRLDGNHWDARRKLAAIYVEAGADARDQAIAAQHELLRLDKLHVPAYRTLAKLYYDGGAPARGSACEQAARLLSVRDPARARDAMPPTPPAMRAMAPADWSRLRHPDEDRAVSALSVLVAPLLAAASATPLEGRSRPGAPLAGDGAPRMTEAVRWVARTLDVMTPELFTRAEQMVPVRFVNGRIGRTLRSALVMGLPLLGDRRRLGELLPPLALQMAQLRPERMLRLLVADADVLTMLLRATVSVACNEPASADLAVTTAALKHSLPPLALDQLGVIGRRLRDQGRDLGRVAAEWLRGADLTAARAALVLSGDLPRTLAAVEACAFDPAGLRQALGELVWVSVTDEVWVTRERMIASAAAVPTAATAQTQTRRQHE